MAYIQVVHTLKTNLKSNLNSKKRHVDKNSTNLEISLKGEKQCQNDFSLIFISGIFLPKGKSNKEFPCFTISDIVDTYIVEI